MISDFSRLRTRQTDEDVPGAKQKKMSGDATQRGLDYHVLGLVDTGSERRPKSMLAIAQEACTAASGQTCSHKNMRDCVATAMRDCVATGLCRNGMSSICLCLCAVYHMLLK